MFSMLIDHLYLLGNKYYRIPKLERRGLDFDQSRVELRKNPSWMTLGYGTPSFVTKHPTYESVLQGVDFGIINLPLHGPKLSKSGQIDHNMEHWNEILSKGVVDEYVQLRVSRWLAQGVGVMEFFSHFKENFKGRSYDSDKPPSNFLGNSVSCWDKEEFVYQTFNEKISLAVL